MKSRALRSLIGFGVALLSAHAQTAPETSPGQPYSKPETPAAKTSKPAVTKSPATPSTAKKAKPEPKKEEPMGKIDGIEIKRGNGYLGIALVEGTFKLSFYDAKKKPIAADVPRAALRWPVAYRPADERTVLNVSGDGKSLTSGKIVKPPHNFKLFITLLPAETAEDAGTETYVVDFRS